MSMQGIPPTISIARRRQSRQALRVFPAAGGAVARMTSRSGTPPVREVARVMTLRNHWWLSGPRGEQMRQLGIAVPVVLGQVVARTVVEALNFTRGDRPLVHSFPSACAVQPFGKGGAREER